MLLTINRFEGTSNEVAIVELPTHSMEPLPRHILPKDTIEGDVVEILIDLDGVKTRKIEVNKY